MSNSVREAEQMFQDQVSIEAVLTYRFHRGLRDTLVSNGLEEPRVISRCRFFCLLSSVLFS